MYNVREVVRGSRLLTFVLMASRWVACTRTTEHGGAGREHIESVQGGNSKHHTCKRGCYSGWRHVRSEALVSDDDGDGNDRQGHCSSQGQTMTLTMLVITSKSYHPRIIPRSSPRPGPATPHLQTGVNPARVLSWAGGSCHARKREAGRGRRNEKLASRLSPSLNRASGQRDAPFAGGGAISSDCEQGGMHLF